MAPGHRPGADRLTHLSRLEDAPEQHNLFHAFRVLEAANPDAPRIGSARRPHEDRVRFGQEAELSFPPSTIASFETKPDGTARLTNRFFGLFGPHGPLPLHLTEYARNRKRQHRDPTFIAFADMLTHRLMTLFYRAWRSGQPAPSFDRGTDDVVGQKVAAIAGYHGRQMNQVDDFPDLSKKHFAGLLTAGPRHAEGLRAIVAGFFGSTVQVQQFVGCWLDLEPGDRWQMGAPVALGRTTSIGERVWSRAAKFRLRIGPLTLAEYERILPGGTSLERLRALVRNYVGDALDWDVNLVLKASDVPRAQLGGTTRLGQTSWIGTRRSQQDADDLFLEPAAQAHPAASSGGE